ncbi:MAG: SDR family NAD(P)-dependent oxidoreductase [Tannerella sp.]|jgi:short-subunit dehydrogenase|nr:SDR family NAD(P)-dependent oxidoreductase [Tannerella sp.]
MKNAVVIGATSGIGKEVALCLIEKGWTVGIAGRRKELLDEIENKYPEAVRSCVIDVTQNDAAQRLLSLVNQMGGIDLFFLATGIGKQNSMLASDIEMRTIETNITGFVRMLTAAYQYFRDKKEGHVAVISSIAGTKGLGCAPSYSASKRFQNTYIESLEQLSNMNRLNIRFTDIRPGFVKTAILDDGHNYPGLMNPRKVAKKIVSAIERKKRVVVIDWRYKILVFFWRLVPGWLWVKVKIRN